jgi:hypothetical protein
MQVQQLTHDKVQKTCEKDMLSQPASEQKALLQRLECPNADS